MKKSLLLHAIVLLSASNHAIHASLIVVENEEQFNKITQSNTPSVIVFSAEWCGGCKALKPTFQKVMDNPEFKHIVFAKVDVDKLDTLAHKQKIKLMPTLFFMQSGQKKHTMVGADTEQHISDAIRTHFGKPAAEAPSATIEEKKQTVTETIKEAATQSKEKIEAVAHDIKDAAIAAKDKVENAISTEQPQEAIVPAQPAEPTGFLQGLVNAFMSAIYYIKDIIMNLVYGIKDFFQNLFSK